MKNIGLLIAVILACLVMHNGGKPNYGCARGSCSKPPEYTSKYERVSYDQWQRAEYKEKHRYE